MILRDCSVYHGAVPHGGRRPISTQMWPLQDLLTKHSALLVCSSRCHTAWWRDTLTYFQHGCDLCIAYLQRIPQYWCVNHCVVPHNRLRHFDPISQISPLTEFQCVFKLCVTYYRGFHVTGVFITVLYRMMGGDMIRYNIIYLFLTSGFVICKFYVLFSHKRFTKFYFAFLRYSSLLVYHGN